MRGVLELMSGVLNSITAAAGSWQPPPKKPKATAKATGVLKLMRGVLNSMRAVLNLMRGVLISITAAAGSCGWLPLEAKATAKATAQSHWISFYFDVGLWRICDPLGWARGVPWGGGAAT